MSLCLNPLTLDDKLSIEDNVGTYNQGPLLLVLLIMSVCALTATVVCALWRSAFLSTWQSCRKSWNETLKCDVLYGNHCLCLVFLNIRKCVAYDLFPAPYFQCKLQHHNNRFILSTWVCSLYWMRCNKKYHAQWNNGKKQLSIELSSQAARKN